LRRQSKMAKILHHLEAGKTITPLEALGLYGSFRLSAVVYSLKKRGYDIYTNLKKDMNGSVYAEYSLVRGKDTDQLNFQF